MSATALLVFPHQLFKDIDLINHVDAILLVEDSHFFYRFNFHKQKLIFHRASMQAYESMLKKTGINVVYFDHETCKKNPDAAFAYCQKKKIDTVYYFDPVDHDLSIKIHKQSKKHTIHLIEQDNPSFLLSNNDIHKIIGTKKRYLMASFYSYMRKKFNILMHGTKPIGGKWSFDAANRLKFSDAHPTPKIPKNNTSLFVQKARKHIEETFPNNPGDTKHFIYPITHEEAEKQLANFLKTSLNNFGPYQDALDAKKPFGFHSILSPLLNSGLLMSSQVIEETLTYAKKNLISINSLEGFIRQILGWREFVRGVYLVQGEKQKKSNFLNHQKHLPKTFWTGKTNIEPLDAAINNVLTYAYAHHIERLMVLGNFMFLSETNPDEVYQWFMEMFIDAYDWVMIPNIYGMSQYADGGTMTTKPYCSTSKYLLKMSHYKKAPWCDLWDALYWHFFYKNKKALSKNIRLSLTISLLNKMKKDTLNEHISQAKNFLTP